MAFEFSIEIETTPEVVFAFLTQPQLVKLWQIDLAEPPPLPPGGLRQGLKQRAIVEEYGKRWEVETMVTSYTVNEQLGYEMQAPNAVVCSEYRLIGLPASTRVEATFGIHPRRFMRILWPLVGGLFRRKIRSRLELLKRATERGYVTVAEGKASLTEPTNPK